MRLWHYKLIPYLPRLQLIGQHRECCALRGLGWGKKHNIVNYVFKYSYWRLFFFHEDVINEILKRKLAKICDVWNHPTYRGKRLSWCKLKELPNYSLNYVSLPYCEHDDNYLYECIDNIKTKMNKEPWKYSKEDFDRFNLFLKELNINNEK